MDTPSSAPSTSIYAPLEDDPNAMEGEAGVSPLEGWGIRCLALDPGEGNEPLRCELVQSYLGKISVTYDALSYTWGDSTTKARVVLNGQPFEITENLHCALRHLRRPHSRRILWIDALCINQADILEVNKYVRRMWAIYEKAGTVIVFLGEYRNNSNLALKLLFQLSSLPLEAGTRHRQITRFLRDTQKISHWNALYQLMRRPWWDRAWIIQEYAVARRVTFLCGNSRLGGDEFNQAMDHLIDYKFNAVVPHNSLHLVRLVASTPISHLLTIRRHYRLSGVESGSGPLNILYRARGFVASDPRDKVYSLFRLIGEHSMLQPDYTCQVRDLYKDVVKAMIESSGTLDVLCHHNRGIVGVSGLPTWCPDWTVMHGRRLLLCMKKYAAAGDSGAQARVHGDTLTIKGKVLDRIQWLSNIFQLRDFLTPRVLFSIITNLKQRVLERVALANRPNFNISTEFWETLVSSRLLKRGPDGWKPHVLDSSTIEEMCDAWFLSLQQPSSLDKTRKNMVKDFTDAMRSALYGRAFFISQQGYLGVVDHTAQINDVVVVALGGEVLFALHETNPEQGDGSASPESTNYQLVGECYMHGFMAGEGLANTSDVEQLSDFHII